MIVVVVTLVGLVIAVIILTDPIAKLVYRRRLRRQGRTATLEEARIALAEGRVSLVRLGRGRQGEIWIVPATARYQEPFAVTVMNNGRLVDLSSKRLRSELIAIAVSKNAYIDIPIVPDVDP
jgi:hypothetical protein